MRQIFISHSSEDAERAASLKAAWSARRPGDKIMLSSEHGAGPRGGTSWQGWIRRAVINSDVILFVASKHSKSEWCSAELGMAIVERTPIVPLRIGSMDQVNALISTIQAEPLDQPIERIVSLVDDRLGPETDGRLRAGALPYPGLKPISDQAMLFGRREEVDSIVRTFNRLVDDGGFVVVSGPSGSGKSSLLMSGVLPRLEAIDWSVTGPIQPNDLAAAPVGDLPDPPRSVVVVDQAEEVSGLDESTRTELCRWTEKIITAGHVLLVIVRIEHRSELDSWTDKAPIDHYISFLDRERLFDVIRGPARLAQIELERGLSERLVIESRSGAALPLLAYTLNQLWERRDRHEERLTHAALDELNGVNGVLELQARAALSAASRGDRRTESQILRLLTTLASPNSNPPTRSPIRSQSLTTEQRGWLDEFQRVGLISYRRSFSIHEQVETGAAPSDTDLVDVTHEALFGWPPLEAAIADQREDNITRSAITAVASAWNDGGGSDATLLLGGDRLQFAVDHDLAAQPRPVGPFVTASIQQDKVRRVRRRLVQLVIAAAILAAVGAVAAVLQFRQANAQRQVAEEQRTTAQSVRVAAQASAATQDQRDLALLAGAAAIKIDKNIDTEGALMNALASPFGPLRFFSDDSARWHTINMLTPTSAVVVTRNAEAAVIDLTTRTIKPFDLPGMEVQAVHPGSLPGTIVVRGRRPPSTWSVAVIRSDGSIAVSIDHDVEISEAVDTGRGLAFGDITGTLFFRVSGSSEASLAVIAEHRGSPITDLDVSVDGTWLASASFTGIQVNHWSSGTWSTSQSLLDSSPTIPIENLTFDRTGPNVLYAAGGDPTIRRWALSVEGPVEEAPLGSHTGAVAVLASDPSAPLVYSAGRGGAIEIWNTATGGREADPLLAHSEDVFSLSTTGDRFLVSGSEQQAVFWDLHGGRVVERSGYLPETWATEHFQALVQGEGPLAAVTVDRRILVADAPSRPAPERARKAWWLRSRSIIVETGDQSQIDLAPLDLWKVDGSKSVRLIDGADAADVGQCLVAYARGPIVEFIDAGDCGRSVAPISIGTELISVVKLSPDETKLLVVHLDNTVEERDLSNGEQTRLVESNERAVATSAHWLSDDQVAVGHDRGSQPEVIDLALKGEEAAVALLPGHDDAVWWFAFDERRRRLYSAGQDALIISTNGTTWSSVGDPWIGSQRRHENDLEAVVRGLRLMDGDQVLVAIHGSHIVAWELDPESLALRACVDAGRILRADEARRLGVDLQTVGCGQ